MKQPTKLLLGIAAAASVTGLAFFGWSAKAKDAATVRLANGVQVTPIEIKQDDDIAQLLDVKMWKFDVTCPAHANSFAVISLSQNGHTPKVIAAGLGTSSATAPSHLHYTISFAPVAGSFTAAKDVKYCVSTGSAYSTGTVPNPFIHAHGYTQNNEAMPAQNSVILMSGNLSKNYISGLASQNEVALSLEFQVYPHSK